MKELKCTCSEIVKPKDCTLHSCPCDCEMSIADELYQYYHSDLRDRYTVEEYLKAELNPPYNK